MTPATQPDLEPLEPSARPALLTVLGDLVFPTGGTAWLGALTRAVGLVGISPEATRQALRRLVSQGLVEPEKHGRLAAYRITSQAVRRFEDAADRIYLRRPLLWDGRWRLLSYSFPEEHRASRDALRRELEWLGFGALGAGLWVSPWDHAARLDSVLAKHGVTGSVESFDADLEGDDRELAARAYDLTELRAFHATFRRRFSPWADDDAVSLDGDEVLRRRILLVHEWRKHLFLDPGLPADLLPEDWEGERAGELFLTLYRSLEQPAWDAWDTIVRESDPAGTAPGHSGSNLDRDGATPSHDGARADDGAPRASREQVAARRTEEFRERIAAGQKVEATDWMPDEYRAMAIKFIEMHANSEIMGALPEREWIARAPTLRRKRSLAAKVQDEVGHAHLIYRVAEDLGKPREQMFRDLVSGRTKFHNVFHYPTETWGDVAVIGFLVDGAAIVTQRALLDTSYGPYLRVMRRVVAEESLHYRHGEDITLALASGTDEQFEMLQDAVNRWWEPVMHFFGHDIPADDDPLLQWGIKGRANEESRQEFLNQYVPKMWDMGIEVPDPALRYDPDTKVWSYTEPDWDKLKAVIKGTDEQTGEVRAMRLEWRRLMRDHHDWIHRIVTGDAPLASTAA